MELNDHYKRAKSLATLLDNKFKIAGFSFGLDPLFDFLPGIGSIIGALTSFYIFWIALKLNVPKFVYFRMVLNILLDTVLGEIPLIGVIFDAFYKSNIKNLNLLEKYLKPDILDAEIIG